MGLNIICSSSGYGDFNPKKDNSNPNPDPKNYAISKTKQIEQFLVVMINYPNCTNYEGNKILVYEGINLKKSLRHLL